MQVNTREKHDGGGDDGLSYGSYCSAKIITLVIDMKKGASALDDIAPTGLDLTCNF